LQKDGKTVKTRSFFIFLLGIALGVVPAFATDFLWIGGNSGDVNDLGNWSGSKPEGDGVDEENVTFSGAVHTNLLLPTLQLNNVTFTGTRSDYTIDGVDSPYFSLTGSLTNDSGANLTINNTLQLSLSDDATHTVSVASGTQIVVFADVLTESGILNKTGSGELKFAGSNNYRGELVADGGTVTLSGESSFSNFRTWTFNNSAVLKVSTPAGIGGGSYVFNNSSKLSAQTQEAIRSDSEASLSFFDNSSFQATAHGLETDGFGVIAGGQMNFHDNTLLKAGVTNSISGGEQNFFDNAILTASGASAITGGMQTFSRRDSSSSDLTRLVVNQSGSISGGTQVFNGFSSLQANNQSGGSVTGGTQEFHDQSYLRASYTNAITGGEQSFTDSAHLDANAYHAVGGVEITLKSESAINLGATDALSPTTEIYFSGADGNTGGYLHLNGFSTTVGEIASGHSENTGFIDNGGSNDATLTVSNSENTTFSGFIADGAGTGTLALVKNGTGTLTLAGASSNYSGGTTVNQGVLVVGANGALGSGTVNVNGVLRLNHDHYGDVQVNSGGVLTGNGFASTASINLGGLLAPGSLSCPIGTLSFNDLTLNAGGSYEWNFKDPSSYDQVSVWYPTTLAINATNGGGEFTIRVLSLDASDNVGMATGFTEGQTYDFTIFTAQHITGFSSDKFKFDTTGFSTDASGSNAIFSINQNGNDLVLHFTPVPEPSTWALLGTGVLAVAIVGRRKRKQA
jgi:autotransporter-associated beta strand protein